MKLVRVGNFGDERPGLMSLDGLLHDLSAFVDDFSGPALDPIALGQIAAIDPSALPEFPANSRLGAPVVSQSHVVSLRPL